MTERIYLSTPHMGGEELKFIQEAFDTNWISPAGPHITNFENELGHYLDGMAVAALASGTSAIHLALIILGVERGDEVICSTFTFSGTCNPIVYLGATPVFVDSEPDTWNMDPDLLKTCIVDRIAKGKKPKAIIPVHLYGMPAKMNEIMAVAKEFEIPVIEDAAEALGSIYHSKKCGTFGDFGVLSFNGNKIITTSGGGALTSKKESLIAKARFLATQARDKAVHYQHSEIGYNYRLSNICAGIGRGQLRVLNERVQQRRNVYENYVKVLSDASITFLNEPEGLFSNRWLTAVLLPNGTDVYGLISFLEESNIETRPLWKPMHQQPVFQQYPSYSNAISDKLFERGICLPSGSNLTAQQQQMVIDRILQFLSERIN
jgi:dTDP-4-amino-4,6-dideoxygalactose transaminase